MCGFVSVSLLQTTDRGYVNVMLNLRCVEIKDIRFLWRSGLRHCLLC